MNLLLAAAAILALIALAQAALLANQIRAWPTWLQVAGGTSVALLLGTLAVIGFRFTRFYLGLRRSPNVEALVAADLRRREESRDAVRHRRVADARRALQAALEAYPLDGASREWLARTGMAPMDIDRLVHAQHVLTSPDAPAGDAWLAAYEREVLGPLDATAARGIKRCAVRLGVLTGLSPRGGLDALLALWASYRLVADLCRIYGLRAGAWGSLVILAHAVAQLVAAVELDHGADLAADHVSDTLSDGMSEGVVATVFGLGSSVAGALFGKAAEGTVNGLFLWALGQRVIRYIRPIQPGAARAPDELVALLARAPSGDRP